MAVRTTIIEAVSAIDYAEFAPFMSSKFGALKSAVETAFETANAATDSATIETTNATTNTAADTTAHVAPDNSLRAAHNTAIFAFVSSYTTTYETAITTANVTTKCANIQPYGTSNAPAHLTPNKQTDVVSNSSSNEDPDIQSIVIPVDWPHVHTDEFHDTHSNTHHVLTIVFTNSSAKRYTYS